MPETVTATLVVSFPSDKDAVDKPSSLLSVRLDDRLTGLNDGNTSLHPGDKIGYLVYASKNLVNIRHFNSLQATVSNLGTDTREFTELLVYANSDSANVDFPILSGFAPTWYGADGGPVNLESGTQDTLLTNQDVTGVLSVTYESEFTQHTINTPSTVNGESTYTVVIVILADIACT